MTEPYEQCSLMPPAEAGFCRWCGGALPPRRSRWCSDAHRMEFERQHDWNLARSAAIRRDLGICQKCGVQTRSDTDPFWRTHPEAPTMPVWDAGLAAGMPRYRLDIWIPQMDTYTKADAAFRRKFCLPVRPEVNHIVPRNGQGYAFGCWNHLDNLETLCHRCHLKVTKQQRSDRRMRQARLVAKGGRSSRPTLIGPTTVEATEGENLIVGGATWTAGARIEKGMVHGGRDDSPDVGGSSPDGDGREDG